MPLTPSGSNQFTPNTILRHAAWLVRRGWVQKTFAARGDGFSTTTDDPYASQFCALGALERSRKDLHLNSNLESVATGWLLDTIPMGSISMWNDAVGRTAEEVAAAMELAAEGNLFGSNSSCA